MEDQSLEVMPTVDPDQILWDNIGFSVKDQNYRQVVSIIVQLLSMLFSVIVAFQLANLKSKADPTGGSCPEEPITPEKAYNEQLITMLIDQVKAKKENPSISEQQLN